VSKEVKTVAGVALVAVVAIAAFFVLGILGAFAVLVAGGLAVVALLQRMDAAPASLTSRGRKRKSKHNDTSDLLHAATSTAEPLTTWTPPDALAPWTPPADDPPTEAGIADLPAPPAAPEHDFWSNEQPVADFSDLAAPPSTDEPTSWLDDPFSTEGLPDAPSEPSWADDTTWEDGSTWDGTRVATDTNPLDDLARLDDIDVIAEFERLDDHPAPAPSMFDVAPPAEVLTPINEAVSSADDIMAASQATELTVPQEDNSELAKLLAKVQARLAAYE
jgi:hypothetical protein